MKKKDPPSGPPGPAGDARPRAKKPSGAQGKKDRRARLEAERRADAARKAGAPDPDALIRPYLQIAPPVLGDPTQALVFATDCLVTALHEVVTDPHTDSGTRRRMVAELGRALGSTHSKAHLQQRLLELRQYDEVAQQQDEGLEPNPLRAAAQLAADLDDDTDE